MSKPAALLPQHQAYLTARGIDAQTIAARGYYSVTCKRALAALRFSPAQQLVPALVLPIWSPLKADGPTTYQIRPDHPRTQHDKARKFEFAPGTTMCLDVSRRARPALDDPRIPLCITEGVPKGDALVSHGACAVSVAGVWNFRGTNAKGGKTLLADFECIALNDRLVYVVFDSDVMLNPDVHAAMERLSAVLVARKARVAYIYLPSTATGDKCGVDDYLAQGHSMAELFARARKELLPAYPVAPLPAPPPAAIPDDPASALDTVSPCTHVANAKRLLREYGTRLHYVLGRGWIFWTGKYWRTDPTQHDALAISYVSGLSHAIAKEAAQLATRASQEQDRERRVALMLLAEERLKWAVQSEHEYVIRAGLALTKTPLLLERGMINADPYLLNVQNGTIDLRTGTLRPHDPADLLTHIAPVLFDPHATCPTWKRFLPEVFAGDAAMVAFIQRAIGWCLTAGQSHQLFLAITTGC
jgi:putative DNA primase/helicase